MTNADGIKLSWPDSSTLLVSGTVDETFEGEKLLHHTPKSFYIDLKNITRINSGGVRQWVRFLRHLENKNLCYINVSSPIVEQFSMIPEFIGKQTTVKSIDARYICLSCNTSQMFTLEIGKDVAINQQEYTKAPERHCNICNEVLEFDHNPESYFYFLIYLQNKPEDFKII